MCVFVKQQSDGCITSPVSNQLEAYKGESLFLPFRTVIGGPVLGFYFTKQVSRSFVDTILLLEIMMGKDSNRTYSNYYSSKGRHDACSDSDGPRDDDWDSSSTSDYGSSRKDRACKIAERQRKAERVERIARAKYFDDSYESSPFALRLVPLSQCAHCDGVHYGKPWQGPEGKKADGRLNLKGCPIQEAFLIEYGGEQMKKMIADGIRCKHPIVDVNGLTVACNGRHPEAIHEKVMWMNAGKEERELSDELLIP